MAVESVFVSLLSIVLANGWGLDNEIRIASRDRQPHMAVLRLRMARKNRRPDFSGYRFSLEPRDLGATRWASAVGTASCRRKFLSSAAAEGKSFFIYLVNIPLDFFVSPLVGERVPQ